MIKLGTVFSGIGAVEHALDRMGLEHEIVFACDNGDIDVLSKKIDVDMDQVETELRYLDSLIDDMAFSDEDNYEIQLLNMLDLAKKEYSAIKEILNLSNIDNNERDIKVILKNLAKTPNLNKSRLKHYNTFITKIDSECSLFEKKLLLYQIILKLSNDFRRENTIEDLGKENIKFNSPSNIDWNKVNKSLKLVYDIFEKDNGRKIISDVRNLSQRVGQLYGKINSLNYLNKVNNISSYKNKKKFVDNIYKGNEKRNKVKLSYMENYDCPRDHFHWDVTFLDGHQYRNNIDLFVGGSPCQSFSMMGKERGLSDTRGTLFYEYARLVSEIQPKVFIYENVRAVLSNDCGRTWEKMKEVFKELGYLVFFTINDKPSILNAKDYGIPQNRNRLFVVGFRSDLDLTKDFEFPNPIPLHFKMQDFLIENAPFGSFSPKTSVDFNNIGDKEFNVDDLEKYFLSEKVKKTVLSPGTKNFYSEPETDLEIARPLVNTMHKMHRACQDNYVTTEGRLRRLTPRECLRLMGFSDSWNIVVSDTAIYQQAGNSIVVDVLIHIIEQILESYPQLTNEE